MGYYCISWVKKPKNTQMFQWALLGNDEAEGGCMVKRQKNKLFLHFSKYTHQLIYISLYIDMYKAMHRLSYGSLNFICLLSNHHVTHSPYIRHTSLTSTFVQCYEGGTKSEILFWDLATFNCWDKLIAVWILLHPRKIERWLNGYYLVLITFLN